MKWLFRIAVALICSVFLVWSALSYLDGVVTHHYANIDDAKERQLFERGWLPDILPRSSEKIRTSNDLDLNISWGQFSFEVRDFASFSVQTSPYEALRSPLLNHAITVEEKRREGAEVRSFYREGTVWVFYCFPSKGFCEYEMWLGVPVRA